MEPNPAPYLPKWSQIQLRTFQNGAKNQLSTFQWVQASKKDAKNWPKRLQETPDPPQNRPKTIPKPTQNRLQNTSEKNSVVRSVFLSRFLDFGSENRQILNDFRSRSSMTISLIFEAFSPAQPIVF